MYTVRQGPPTHWLKAGAYIPYTQVIPSHDSHVTFCSFLCFERSPRPNDSTDRFTISLGDISKICKVSYETTVYTCTVHVHVC